METKYKRLAMETIIVLSLLVIIITAGTYLVNYEHPPLRATTTDASPDYVLIFIVICFISAIIMFFGIIRVMYMLYKENP